MAEKGKVKRELSQKIDSKPSRKVVPVAVMGIGDDSNWNVSDVALDGLAHQCGIKFDTQARDLVRWFLMSHLTIANQWALAPKADEIINILNKLSKQARSLLGSLVELKPNGRPDVQHAWSALVQAGFSDASSRNLQAQISSLLASIPVAGKALEGRTTIKVTSGRQPRPHLQDFIWQLAFIFERAGGRASANYSPNARRPGRIAGGRKSPFINFVFGLMANLPTSMQEDYAALAEVIDRALAVRPKGWTPPNLKMAGQNSK